jgi:hypothetical protein
MAKPTIVLSTGSFGYPSAYDAVVSLLKPHNITMHIPHLPTVGPAPKQGRDGPAPSMFEDAKLLASTCEKLADEGKDIVLMAHSYGGIPMTECVKGLTKREREAQGRKGGIVRLGYVTAMVAPVGRACMDLLAEVPEENRMDFAINVSSSFVLCHLCPFSCFPLLFMAFSSKQSNGSILTGAPHNHRKRDGWVTRTSSARHASAAAA